jgi:GAF domain-containing protein
MACCGADSGRGEWLRREEKMMNTPQRVIENLLLVTAASRAMLELARANGGFAIDAEAVQHAQHQVRHHDFDTGMHDAETIATLQRDRDIIVQDDIERTHAPASDPETGLRGIRARMLAPLIQVGRLVGVISLHHSQPRRWSAQDKNAMLDAQAKILDILMQRACMEAPALEDLRSVAAQAILDRVRIALGVQRCTFRQPVQEAYAFPVTFESRAEGMRSLLGDFTIVQSGQPVIVKLLAERKQVVQEDCSIASSDPLFHKMLAHYGGMRAQVVTPVIIDDQLKGVLSVHELRHPRAWTIAEKALAAEAAALIGAIFETPQYR